MKGIIRKTILGIWFFGGLSACTSKPHFTIEGSLDEKVDGEAYIVGYPGWNKKPDTLARAEIRDGKFTLTGSLPDTMEAGLYITGEKTYAILLLENADYRAHLHLKNPEANRVEGPELQLPIRPSVTRRPDKRMNCATVTTLPVRKTIRLP